jgi:hypothetical protein
MKMVKGQILHANYLDDQQAPIIDSHRPTHRNSGTSAMSNDDNSIQSMHSKAWSELMDDGTGSIPTMPTSSKKLQFIFDPGSSEFPPLPNNSNPRTSQRQDAASVGSTSTVTKTEFEQFQTKLSNDLAANLKECRSLASSMTGDDSNK